MKITITGSLGNISKILVEKLLDHNHEVSVITSSSHTIDRIRKLGAIPILGKLDDENFVYNAFKNMDAVYLMIPPSYQTTDAIKKVGDIYFKAIKGNKVPRVVYLSGIGAHLKKGPGPTSANYYNEQQLNLLEDSQVLHLRPGMFYSNFYAAIDLIRNQNIIANNFDEHVPLALSHPQDIADAAFEAIHFENFTGKSIQYIVSAEITGKIVAKVLGSAINMPALRWVQLTDQRLLEKLIQQGMTAQMATMYIIQMGIALREGQLLKSYFTQKPATQKETISFEVFAKEFAHIYSTQN